MCYHCYIECVHICIDVTSGVFSPVFSCRVSYTTSTTRFAGPAVPTITAADAKEDLDEVHILYIFAAHICYLFTSM